MSQDIRSFFKVVPKNQKINTVSTSNTKKKPKVLDSSDEDVVEATPEKPKRTVKKRKVRTLSSDTEESLNANTSVKKKKEEPQAKLKPTSALEALGSAPVVQSKVKAQPIVSVASLKDKIESNNRKSKSKSRNKSRVETGSHESDAFEKTLLDLDDDFLTENLDVLDKTIEQANSNHEHNDTPKKQKLEITEKTPSRKRKISENAEVQTPEERYEKKRHSAMLYQKYKNRGGPPNHGCKDYPKGKPDCLKNLCFLRTGVLDSLEDTEFDDLIHRHGGRTVHSISKKVNYVVVGDEPGPAKIEKAKNYGIPAISEDELLDIIRTKSGLKSSCVKKESDEKVTEMEINNCKTESIDCTIPSVTKKTKKSPKPKQTEPSETITKPAIVKLQTSHKNLTWTEKYKPTDIKNIIGQQGDKSNMHKLLNWLQNWHRHNSGKNKQKLAKPSPWNTNHDGSSFKCALLSGPPGVGKTTTAVLVAEQVEFDVVEFNASDTRSKKLLHEQVAQLLSTRTLAGFAHSDSHTTKKRVLLMDEVDGMAGNEDRGGMQELISLIKTTKVPIICMCNDRNHQKIRSLANYCYDLRFSKPRLEQIRGAMMSICFKENLKISPDALSEIIVGTGMDIRQTLNHLSMWTASDKTLSKDTATKEANAAKKDTVLGPFDVIRRVFSKEAHQTMTIGDRERLFFFDYSIGPLFVQENYLAVNPSGTGTEILRRAALAADSISMGDVVDAKMRSSNNWSLLQSEAIFASVLPGHYMEGHLGSDINFPSWLGKNSKRAKFQRLLGEIQAHTRTSMSGNRLAVNLDYLKSLRDKIVTPLVKRGADGIEDALLVMNSYQLLREDLDSVVELSVWRGQKNPMASVESKVKAAFTRAYNKEAPLLSYAIPSVAQKKRVIAKQDEGFEEEESELSEEEGEEDVTKDAFIKAKKNTNKAEERTKRTQKTSTSRGKGKK